MDLSSSGPMLAMASAAIFAMAGSKPSGAPPAWAMLFSCSSLIPFSISACILIMSGFSDIIRFISSIFCRSR